MRAGQSFHDLISRLGQSSQARHLAVPIALCDRAESVRSVLTWAEPASFNNVPVASDGVVVGVIENLLGDYSDLPRPSVVGRASEAMRPLAADMLVDASEPIASLPELLLVPPHYRLVLEAGRIGHVITPSDLGKLPMRVFLFAKVALLEQALSDAIRRRYPDDEEAAVSTLEQGAQAQILGNLRSLHERNLNPSLLEVTTLPQKAQILFRSGGLEGSEDEIAAEFRTLYQDFRNPIVHAGPFINDSLDALRGLRDLIKAARRRIREADDQAR